MIRARHGALLALVVSWTLAACGGPAGPSPTVATGTQAPTPTPLGGTPLHTDSFTTVVPATWTDKLGDPTEVAKFSANGKVEMLVEQPPPGTVQANINDVTANINVLLLPSAVPDDQVQTYLQSVANNGATNLSSAQSFTIDGSTGQFITYDRDIQGTPGESQDMIINHRGSTFDIVLNTSQFAFNTQLAGLQAVLTAWRWTS